MTPSADDPFMALGLDHRADLTDDDVRVAWRRIAAATHPDRADGGNPEAFAVAAAAYADLRTAFGRGEARATTRASRPVSMTRRGALSCAIARMLADVAATSAPLGCAHLVRLAVRVVAAAGAATAGVIAAGPGPAGPALAAGAVTWLLVTARHDVGRLRIRRSRSPRFSAGGDRAGRIGGPR